MQSEGEDSERGECEVELEQDVTHVCTTHHVYMIIVAKCLYPLRCMNSNSDNALFEMQGCLICAICKGEVDYSESDEQSLSLKKMMVCAAYS